MSSWRYLKSNMWAYNHTGNFGDSAVAVYWDPKPLAPGRQGNMLLYYGIEANSRQIIKIQLYWNLNGNMFLKQMKRVISPIRLLLWHSNKQYRFGIK